MQPMSWLRHGTAVTLGLLFVQMAGAQITILNPYAGVDWEAWRQVKANFHAHTTYSDGVETPAAMLAAYRERGYGVLALTDHDAQVDLRAPPPRPRAPRGLVLVDGYELSMHHHMVSLFCRVGWTLTEEAALIEIGAAGGLAIFAHPDAPEGWKPRPAAWYVPFFETYPHLIGMEATGPLWDEVLLALMPDRPVWGFHNDDAHRKEHIGSWWNVLLLPRLSAGAVREALCAGRFYLARPGSPVIKAVRVNPATAVIELDAEPGSTVRWLHGTNTVGAGPRLDCRALPAEVNYVRAEVAAAKGATTLTNPFGIRRGGRTVRAAPGSERGHWRQVRRERLRQMTAAQAANWAVPYDTAIGARSRDWEVLDLRGVVNRAMTGPEGWIGRGPLQLYHLTPGRHWIHGVPFTVLRAGAGRGGAVVALRSEALPTSGGVTNPAVVSVPVGMKCRAVYVLHGAAYVNTHGALGTYEVVYDDGSRVPIEVIGLGPYEETPEGLQAGIESVIQDWWPSKHHFDNPPDAFKVMVTDPARVGDMRYLYTLRWLNARPEATVQELILRARPESRAVLMVLAITVQRAP